MDAKQIADAVAGYLTTAEAAKELRLTVRAVQSLCKDGKLTAIPWGRDWRIQPESVAARKKAQKNGEIHPGGRPRNSNRGKDL